MYVKNQQADIFNSDQGCQFTSEVFTKRLLDAEIKISMDGKERCHDHIFVERLSRARNGVRTREIINLI